MLRSDGNVEVGILGGDIIVRRAGWLARVLLESCLRGPLGRAGKAGFRIVLVRSVIG